MSRNVDEMIYGVPRRPRIADASASAILLAIAGGILAGPPGALVGAAAGGALANQRQPLEMAIRGWLSKNNLELVFFYPAPKAVKITFKDAANDYWTAESILPTDLPFASADDIADWLYGNLISNELPQVALGIRQA